MQHLHIKYLDIKIKKTKIAIRKTTKRSLKFSRFSKILNRTVLVFRKSKMKNFNANKDVVKSYSASTNTILGFASSAPCVSFFNFLTKTTNSSPKETQNINTPIKIAYSPASCAASPI